MKLIFNDSELAELVQDLFETKELIAEGKEDENGFYVVETEITDINDKLSLMSMLSLLSEGFELSSQDILRAGKELQEITFFHDQRGRFVRKKDLEGKKGSLVRPGKRKQAIKVKKGVVLGQRLYNTGWGRKDPCGRDARRQGADVKCSEGQSFKKIQKLKSKMRALKAKSKKK